MTQTGCVGIIEMMVPRELHIYQKNNISIATYADVSLTLQDGIKTLKFFLILLLHFDLVHYISFCVNDIINKIYILCFLTAIYSIFLKWKIVLSPLILMEDGILVFEANELYAFHRQETEIQIYFVHSCIFCVFHIFT